MGSEDSLGSRIASLVHAHFDALPPRSKPTIRPDGTREWIPMSGIVLVRGENTPSESLTCICIATGAKCLAASQIPNCKGLVLHDWHAEVLVMRAFNYWLLSECRGLLTAESLSSEGEQPSRFIRFRQQGRGHPSRSTGSTSIQSPDSTPPHPEPPFELQSDVKVYMYCTCAPCGDASMELCMAAQDDPTPWATPEIDSNAHISSDTDDPGSKPEPTLLDGRAHFSRLGVVRRKPSRADAVATKSKSCSDKLALRQVSSLLSCGSSLLVAATQNAYLEAIVLPDEEISREGCDRAFGDGGRMGLLKGRMWGELNHMGSKKDGQDNGSSKESEELEQICSSQYGYHPFKVLSIPNTQLHSLWPFSKNPPADDSRETNQDGPQDQGQDEKSPRKPKPGNISVLWIAAPSTPDAAGTPSDNGAKTMPKLCGSKTGLYETIINGVKQGTKASAPVPRGASGLSRAKLWGLQREIVQILLKHSRGELGDGFGEDGVPKEHVEEGGRAGDSNPEAVLRQVIEASSYQALKEDAAVSIQSAMIRQRAIQDAKTVLVPWVPNIRDEAWGLEVLSDTGSKKRKR
ncbi:hypothetical protein P168DRAFT_235879 [Aspergillus campestris IBT 28561]|uniref:A to I editase domain-containing protein n=1 Tax=Aspergillus campestris (strain IBT 28561) TaxID=1392248 RepID=A0A2I1D2Z3_ASPC2|nr:uncharacterized protein P168DRAFT_235879 [Aspergillus campestris IBT 28561]PKY04244.1 hypothetical protein P168DRAFT_235879 [Aspergillus campestris IBT 28561]